MKRKLLAFAFHGIYAHFEVPKGVYEKALEHWSLKHEITHQTLPRKVFKYFGRKVDVRIYPKGKVSFIIGATEKPLHFNQINAIYKRIVNDLQKITPEVKHKTLQFRISRCDVHYDCVSLPPLYPVIPKLGTIISVHRLHKQRLYRIEVRGPFNDAVKTLAQILGIKELTF